MAIIGPADLPVILKVPSDPIKKYVLSQMGHPVVEVEIAEDQLETALKTTGDHIAHYFSKEQRLAVFNTQPLQSTYNLPDNAYWVHDVSWDPAFTRLDLIFGAESFLFNIGNITGIQQILTDFHLLQQYRRFSQRILSNEGHFEVLGDNKIRLFPTPKGAFPVVVLFTPVISDFRTPANRRLIMDMALAETMIAVGHARGKYAGLPSPDGGMLNLDGEALKTKGFELRKEVMQDALNLSSDPEASAIFRY